MSLTHIQQLYNCNEDAFKFIYQAGFQHSRSKRLITDVHDKHVGPSISIMHIAVQTVGPPPSRIMSKPYFEKKWSHGNESSFAPVAQHVVGLSRRPPPEPGTTYEMHATVRHSAAHDCTCTGLGCFSGLFFCNGFEVESRVYFTS